MRQTVGVERLDRAEAALLVVPSRATDRSDERILSRSPRTRDLLDSGNLGPLIERLKRSVETRLAVGKPAGDNVPSTTCAAVGPANLGAIRFIQPGAGCALA